MNSIAKAAVSSKLSSVSKGLGLDVKTKGMLKDPQRKNYAKLRKRILQRELSYRSNMLNGTPRDKRNVKK